MKTMRFLFALMTATLAATIIASAQTIDFLFVTKLRDYEQTSTADPVLVTDPYIVAASVGGTGLSSSFPMSPTVAVSSGTETLITLSFDFDEWDFESIGYVSHMALDIAYGSGNYTFQSSSFSNTVLALSSGDLYPNAPKATISTNSGLGFTWSGGVLFVDPSQFTTLTVQTNAFATNFSASANHIAINGESFQSEVGVESFNSATDNLSVDIASATFLGGSSSKNIEIEFNNLINFFPDTPSTGITAVSAFTSITSFNIQVIPEPSTYAAILGALALAGVAIHRRRRTA